jgi:Flp pilus assembly protein CpaB
MQRRSTTLILIGILTLVLGAATTVAAMRASAGPATPARGKEVEPSVAQTDGLEIPEGKRALSVALDPVAGSAGIAHAGTRVDVFAAVSEKESSDGHAARMIMQAIPVLRIEGASATAGSAGRSAKDALEVVQGSTVFVLAVTPAEAEKIVYHASFSKLWFSIVPAATTAKVPPTPGVTAANQLNPEG